MANPSTVSKQRAKPAASGAGRAVARLPPRNRKLLKWLDSWLATPDPRGEEWWNGLENDLRNQRTTLSK